MAKESNESRHAKELCIRLLGEMRDPEAVNTLFNEIEFSSGIVRDPTLGGFYPCVGALIKIGNPAVRHLLEGVAEKPRKDILTLHAYIIQVVEGSHEVGALKIKKALKDSVGERREYLQALLTVYNQKRFVGE